MYLCSYIDTSTADAYHGDGMPEEHAHMLGIGWTFLINSLSNSDLKAAREHVENHVLENLQSVDDVDIDLKDTKWETTTVDLDGLGLQLHMRLVHEHPNNEPDLLATLVIDQPQIV